MGPKKKKKKRTKDSSPSQNGPRGSQFRREINITNRVIEDSLERLSPAKLGFESRNVNSMNGGPMTRHGSTRAGSSFPRSPQRSPARSPGRRFSNPREPQNLSRPGRLPSRPSTGNILSIRENRKAKPTRSANREAHRNWGSLCS